MDTKQALIVIERLLKKLSTPIKLTPVNTTTIPTKEEEK